MEAQIGSINDLLLSFPNNPEMMAEGGRIARLLSEYKDTTDLSVLRGLSILDLGCGSELSKDRLGKNFPPYFARVCALAGASVIGIDLFPQSKADTKLFKGVSADLVTLLKERKLSELPELEGKTFDIINCSWLVSNQPAPYLMKVLEQAGLDISSLRRELIDQSKPLLKKFGLLALDQQIIRV